MARNHGKTCTGGEIMAEIFKNLTDNPWFWATVALTGLMLINHLVTKVKRTLWCTKKLIVAFLITATGFVNTAVKTMEKFSSKKQEGIKTEKNIKENKKAGK